MLQRLAEQMGRAIDVTSTYICGWDLRAGLVTVLAEYYSRTPARKSASLIWVSLTI